MNTISCCLEEIRGLRTVYLGWSLLTLKLNFEGDLELYAKIDLNLKPADDLKIVNYLGRRKRFSH